MNYNFYKFDYNDSIINIEKRTDLDEKIIQQLEKIEDEIVNEYLSAQEEKVGILKLGNQIRYNKTLKVLFDNPHDESVIIKMTENKRSFFNVFIESISKYQSKKIYFFILEDSFGKQSNLVDKTFIKIKDVKKTLHDFFTIFNLKKNATEIYFIEMKGFSNYNITTFEEYSKIEKIKNE
ncbi:hypothetical protein [Myroides odoratus]|uniref:Uncharacterized protein n=1 Tax=Myroides odoratus TaxID=256 RepID=A0A9Q7E915_MYROD|nr:hypothetical protein [Myroides odoratus]EHQ43244.1 hypothetical protein Myrod_2421 [Myroides odoratus DSM 2801]EKB06629.1 hypothetical protein HMPREF9716_02284 [Myroides odoratus CIP 103059]QQU00587.1 hypothetical protein I6I88_02110 [Myroides odoratus]WQD57180.1 hypothetical protein U0010_16920 [Myroides odoratus]STZ30519.1 Uncharacterised protein [Myroides odoratus]